MKRLLLLSIFLAGCPDQFGQQCGNGTVPIGQFNLALTGEHDAGECLGMQSDGGLGSLAVDGTMTATLCYSARQLQLLVPTKQARASDLLDDGGFKFTGSSSPVVGTACDAVDAGGCPVAIDQVFSGNLLTGGDAGFAVQPDGGLPVVTSVTGVLVDNLTTTASAGCVCTLPCRVTWAVTGTRF